MCEHGRRRPNARSAEGRRYVSTAATQPVQGVHRVIDSEHGRRRSSARCGGSSICEHGRRRTCKECGGRRYASTAADAAVQGVRRVVDGGEHGRRRSQCKGAEGLMRARPRRSQCKVRRVVDASTAANAAVQGVRRVVDASTAADAANARSAEGRRYRARPQRSTCKECGGSSIGGARALHQYRCKSAERQAAPNASCAASSMATSKDAASKDEAGEGGCETATYFDENDQLYPPTEEEGCGGGRGRGE